MAKRYPKLRFALITEDALEMLRPETKSQDSNVMEVKDMYETISNTVNVILEQKLRNLKLDKLDQLIEDKVCEIQDRHREIRKNARGLETPKSTGSDVSINTISDFDIKPIRPKKLNAANGMHPKQVKKDILNLDFPYKKRPKSHENKTTNNKKCANGNANAIRNMVTKDTKIKNSAIDIATKYFKYLDDRSKRKQQ